MQRSLLLMPLLLLLGCSKQLDYQQTHTVRVDEPATAIIEANSADRTIHFEANAEQPFNLFILYAEDVTDEAQGNMQTDQKPETALAAAMKTTSASLDVEVAKDKEVQYYLTVPKETTTVTITAKN